MACNSVELAVPPEAIFAVLSDARAYRDFVVGTKAIRRFEPTWPDEGSVLHHSQGVGPFVIQDTSTVVENEPGRRLVLLAGLGALAVNKVAFELSPSAHGTRVDVEEYPVEGPLAAIWNPVLDWLMSVRNQEMLCRLGRLSERRAARPAPAG